MLYENVMDYCVRNVFASGNIVDDIVDDDEKKFFIFGKKTSSPTPTDSPFSYRQLGLVKRIRELTDLVQVIMREAISGVIRLVPNPYNRYVEDP